VAGTDQSHITSQNSERLNYTVAEAWILAHIGNDALSIKICLPLNKFIDMLQAVGVLNAVNILSKLSLRGHFAVLLLQCITYRYEYRDCICTFTTYISIMLYLLSILTVCIKLPTSNRKFCFLSGTKLDQIPVL
jgi:hypothetical protein